MMSSSGLVYLGWLLLLQILAVQSVVQNVTRRDSDKGDSFSNPDKSCKSDSCWSYKGIKVGGSSMSTNCKCSCNNDKTFVGHNTTCVDNDKVHSNLLASLPTKDALFRVRMHDISCRSFSSFNVMPVLDITRPSNRTLCLFMADITKCTIIKKDSLYFYMGEWYQIWPTNKKQDTFTITEDDEDSYLKWTSLGKQFSGLIFGLKISCQLKGSQSDDTIGSYLIFKSAGSHYFDGVKPTLTPISSAPTPAPTEPSSTPQSSTTASPSGKGKSSGSSGDKGLIAGVSICVILILIVIIVAVVFYLRRKRNDAEKPSEGAKCEANPTYEIGQDRSLPVTVNGQPPTYDYPDTSGGYQPLVQNTRMRDASGKVPVYSPLSRETKNNGLPVVQMKTPDKRGLAYETVAIPVQQPTTDEPGLAESPEYEDPTNPTIPNEGGLYAVSRPQDDNNMDFENTEYIDPESVIKIG